MRPGQALVSEGANLNKAAVTFNLWKIVGVKESYWDSLRFSSYPFCHIKTLDLFFLLAGWVGGRHFHVFLKRKYDIIKKREREEYIHRNCWNHFSLSYIPDQTDKNSKKSTCKELTFLYVDRSTFFCIFSLMKNARAWTYSHILTHTYKNDPQWERHYYGLVPD